MKLTKSVAVAIVGLVIAVSGTLDAQAFVPESKQPIKLAITDYSGDNIVVYIYGDLISKLGYDVDYLPVDYLGQFTAVASGDLDIGSPGWDTTAKAVMKKVFASGKVLNMGQLGVAAHEDWWYPLYVKKVCPGLPDWKALKNPDCVKALSAPETEPKARFLGGPVAWGGHDAERIKALGLNFQIIHAGSAGALVAGLVATIKRKQPILAWAWEPYWIQALYPGQFVKWPAYADACYTDASWGGNAHMKYDCGHPSGFLWKTAWAGGEKIWPKAYAVLRKYKLDTKTLGELVYQSDVKEIDPKDVAQKWVSENKAIWSPWLK